MFTLNIRIAKTVFFVTLIYVVICVTKTGLGEVNFSLNLYLSSLGEPLPIVPLVSHFCLTGVEPDVLIMIH